MTEVKYINPKQNSAAGGASPSTAWLGVVNGEERTMKDEPRKLDAGQKHLLKLIAKEQACPDGWAPVSKIVYPLLEAMPGALVEVSRVGDEGRGRARLTEAGQSLLDAMAWL
jgi:hypothetical protein